KRCPCRRRGWTRAARTHHRASSSTHESWCLPRARARLRSGSRGARAARQMRLRSDLVRVRPCRRRTRQRGALARMRPVCVKIQETHSVLCMSQGSPSGTRSYVFSEVNMDVKERIRKQVTENRVVLYMKGTPEAPQCGFSAAAVQLLEASGAEDVATVNVLADADIRQGIKDFSNWPTIPQLYVNGEFVGGADIMREMYQSGELQKLVK